MPHAKVVTFIAHYDFPDDSVPLPHGLLVVVSSLLGHMGRVADDDERRGG